MRATEFLADFESVRGPPKAAVAKRLACEMHERSVLGDCDLKPTDAAASLSGRNPGGPKDIVIYARYDPSNIPACAWNDPDAVPRPGGDGDHVGPRVVPPRNKRRLAHWKSKEDIQTSPRVMVLVFSKQQRASDPSGKLYRLSIF